MKGTLQSRVRIDIAAKKERGNRAKKRILAKDIKESVNKGEWDEKKSCSGEGKILMNKNLSPRRLESRRVREKGGTIAH